MSHRSVSQFNTFSRCGEAYRLERTGLGLPKRPAAWTALGSAFHEAYETWERTNRELLLDFLFLDYYWAWIDKLQERQPNQALWQKTPNVKTVERDIELRAEAGAKQANAYQQHCEQSKWKLMKFPDGTLALELRFELMFGDTQIMGYIDKVEVWDTNDGPQSIIVDLKTGNKENTTNWQLGTYSLALRELFNTDVRLGQMWYTKLGTGSGYIDLTRYTRDYLHDQYTKLDFSINNNLFLVNPGKQCQMCSVKPWCREQSGT
jgi:putative RecB family exonuclease